MQADEAIAEVWSSFDDCLREDVGVLCVRYLHDRAELIERFNQPPNKIIQDLSSSSKVFETRNKRHCTVFLEVLLLTNTFQFFACLVFLVSVDGFQPRETLK